MKLIFRATPASDKTLVAYSYAKDWGIVFMAIGVVLGLLAIATYLHNGTPEDKTATHLGNYFAERIFEEGTKNGFIPIEGFTAELLIRAFPGLLASDFEGVETYEGVYSVKGGELQFTRTQSQPISTAEQTVSRIGYETLLENVSVRLSHPVYATSDVDALIERITFEA